MENASLPNDVWNNVTTSSSEHDRMTTVRDLILKVVYITIGTVGIVDNLFVIIVFALFIKITDKVCRQHSFNCAVEFVYVSRWMDLHV